MSLTGKVALITGASKGIGKATAVQLAREGAHVVITYSSDPKAAEETVGLLGEKGYAIKSNAGNLSEIEALVKEVVEKFKRIDILIPNAGILTMKDLESTTEQDFENAMALNVKGPYFLTQKAVPYMAPGSHVILVSTTQCVASTVQPAYLLYNTTKGAIEQMVRVMAKDLGRKQIMVNAVSPGPTGTELFYKGKSEQLIKMIGGFSPFNRIGEPDEIAEAMVFLAKSRWVSGQTLRVNGATA